MHPSVAPTGMSDAPLARPSVGRFDGGVLRISGRGGRAAHRRIRVPGSGRQGAQTIRAPCHRETPCRRAATGALALALASAPALAEDLDFTLANDTGSVLSEFYASPSDVGEWEEDILGSDVLGPGESVDITIADGRTQCEYDLRFVFDDGSETIVEAEDICETGSYPITE